MKKDINYYLNLPYEIKIVRLDDGDYYAQYADARLNKLVLMSGDGKTPNEAIDNLQNAFKSYLEYAIEAGRKIPGPIDENKKVRVKYTDYNKNLIPTEETLKSFNSESIGIFNTFEEAKKALMSDD
ncbi:type II toxin-antitoxin system HicB family antitoxin [Campylobacter gastrosuis]|uniref:Type II toxin-antitoxin system HicB family antitoxin n=1 Tax=Campylobacter gastrosuis TaxID=2974576 RepID=A0ABT7HT60_9BACT|nr:type II toxin-antitoxin system HicB family antitoxin [Campylobacter gastrosuis]MDL0089983.1 type II toxin-antitoxin system HicB family antitoxin [Campylobacter gastrosuis]